MAEEKKVRRLKKSETVRERSEKAAAYTDKKPRRLRTTAGKITSPVKSAAQLGKKEYYLPLPDNRTGRFLNRRRKFIPKFFRDAWEELRQVDWPSARETWKLTLAVFVFAIVFGVLIALVDTGLDKVFKEILLK